MNGNQKSLNANVGSTSAATFPLVHISTSSANAANAAADESVPLVISPPTSLPLYKNSSPHGATISNSNSSNSNNNTNNKKSNHLFINESSGIISVNETSEIQHALSTVTIDNHSPSPIASIASISYR